MKYEDWKKNFVDGGDKSGIMTHEQHEGGYGVPKEYVGNFDDFQSLSLTEQDTEVLENLYNVSLNDGFEHGAALIDGKLYEFTSDLQGEVAIPGDVKTLINAAPDRSVHLYHSHTNTTPHSAADLQWLLNEKIDKIDVIAYNGDAYSVSVGTGWIPDTKEFKDAVDIIRDEVYLDVFDYPGYDYWSLDEQYYVRVKEQTYRIAQHFKWKIEGGSLL